MAERRPPTNLDAGRLLRHYTTMSRIRAFEEAGERAQKAGLVLGAIHLSIGQEAVASGVCMNLERRDILLSTHRGHGHTLAKGADPEAMMRELFGREGGICGGKGGSMHIADFGVGMLGANGVVAANIPIAVGAAHAIKLQGGDRVVTCFFGDGAANRGPFLEGLNWARVFELPILFVCEDNGFAATTRTRAMSAGEGPAARAASLDIPTRSVDGNDVLAVDEAAAALLAEVRAGGGARFLLARTYRLSGHTSTDPAAYRPAAEVEAAREQDPLRLCAGLLDGAGVAGETLAEAREAAAAEMEQAYHAAAAAPWPALPLAYADVQDVGIAPAGDEERMNELSYLEAGKAALAEAMREDPSVWALGEDLGRGGVFGQYRGLVEEFGPARIADTPISEACIMGAAVGAAMMGTRPVVEMRFSDFALCAVDELVNQAAKARYMFGGQAKVPLVVRQPIGMWRSSAAQHSQSLEAWYTHVPGLVVVAPATPADNKALLLDSIRCDDPVVYMEHKGLWPLVGPVDEEEPARLGKARVVRGGGDVTLVTWSALLHEALRAADALAGEIAVEVIDLRTLWPWDRDCVLASVEKTGRLLVAHEAVQAGGFGAEVAATVGETLFRRLKAPVRRLGSPRIPVSYAPNLEAEVKITAERDLVPVLRALAGEA